MAVSVCRLKFSPLVVTESLDVQEGFGLSRAPSENEAMLNSKGFQVPFDF